ncbi:MAG: helix-turn-helix domain-containing protein [Oligoflexus sp.]|nr:helix-turn-helix domain-containing protein [Oligoflexus sp.]
MAIRWRLKKYLATLHGIYTVTDFQEIITKKTGIRVSHSNLCRYVNDKPKSMRFEILEIFCSTMPGVPVFKNYSKRIQKKVGITAKTWHSTYSAQKEKR